MDMETLWAGTCDLLQQEISAISYNTWIGDNLSPIKLENDCLLLRVRMETMRAFVVKQYQQLIDRCLVRAANRPMRAELLIQAEADERLSPAGQAGKEETPKLNPKDTF